MCAEKGQLVSSDDSPPAESPAGTDAVAALKDTAVLDGIEERPLAEHADVYEALHEQLRAALAEIDNA